MGVGEDIGSADPGEYDGEKVKTKTNIHKSKSGGEVRTKRNQGEQLPKPLLGSEYPQSLELARAGGQQAQGPGLQH